MELLDVSTSTGSSFSSFSFVLRVCTCMYVCVLPVVASILTSIVCYSPPSLPPTPPPSFLPPSLQVVDIVLFCFNQGELKRANFMEFFPSLSR